MRGRHSALLATAKVSSLQVRRMVFEQLLHGLCGSAGCGAALPPWLWIYWATLKPAEAFVSTGIATRKAQYLCTHYTLLAHAAASAKLRQISHGAQVSLNFNENW